MICGHDNNNVYCASTYKTDRLIVFKFVNKRIDIVINMVDQLKPVRERSRQINRVQKPYPPELLLRYFLYRKSSLHLIPVS